MPLIRVRPGDTLTPGAVVERERELTKAEWIIKTDIQTNTLRLAGWARFRFFQSV